MFLRLTGNHTKVYFLKSEKKNTTMEESVAEVFNGLKIVSLRYFWIVVIWFSTIPDEMKIISQQQFIPERVFFLILNKNQTLIYFSLLFVFSSIDTGFFF